MTQPKEDFPLAPLDYVGAERLNRWTSEVKTPDGSRIAKIVARPAGSSPSIHMVNVFRIVGRGRRMESYGNFRTLRGVAAYLVDQAIITQDKADELFFDC